MKEPTTEHRMVGMNVSVPESLRDYVQSRLVEGFGSVSEYVRQLIRQDQQRLARVQTESVLAEGLASGQFDRELVEEAFRELRVLRQGLESRGSSASMEEVHAAIDEGRE